MANSRDIDRLVSISAARTVTGSIYDVSPRKVPKAQSKAEQLRIAREEAAAIMASEPDNGDRFY